MFIVSYNDVTLKIVAISKSTKYFLYNHSKQLLDGSALNRLTQIK